MKRNETNTCTEVVVIVRTRDIATGRIVGDSASYNVNANGYLGKRARDILAHQVAREADGCLLDAVNGPPGPARN